MNNDEAKNTQRKLQIYVDTGIQWFMNAFREGVSRWEYTRMGGASIQKSMNEKFSEGLSWNRCRITIYIIIYFPESTYLFVTPIIEINYTHITEYIDIICTKISCSIINKINEIY